MTGYAPVEMDIRAARGLPYATGADEPPAWHDRPGGEGLAEVHAALADAAAWKRIDAGPAVTA
jgi:hypothetical protein